MDCFFLSGNVWVLNFAMLTKCKVVSHILVQHYNAMNNSCNLIEIFNFFVTLISDHSTMELFVRIWLCQSLNNWYFQQDITKTHEQLALAIHVWQLGVPMMIVMFRTSKWKVLALEDLTLWGRMTHVCVSEMDNHWGWLVIFLLHQVNTATNYDILSNVTLKCPPTPHPTPHPPGKNWLKFQSKHKDFHSTKCIRNVVCKCSPYCSSFILLSPKPGHKLMDRKDIFNDIGKKKHWCN